MKIFFIALSLSFSMAAFATPETSCNIQIANAKGLLNEDNTADDEEAFLLASTKALNVCQKSAENHSSLRSSLSHGRKSCDMTADQGLSQFYRGTCYLKAADLADFILGMQ
ncbi:MAG: hypothetical protein AB7O96_08630 [Pseudobdellovibrionaceae bacterium]